MTARQAQLSDRETLAVNVPQLQRRPPALPLAELANRYHNREQAMVAANMTGVYSYQAIAQRFGVHVTTVGRIVRKARSNNKE